MHNPLPTRMEFSRRLDAARREETWVGIVWLICFFAMLLAQIPTMKWVNSTGSQILIVVQIAGIATILLGNIFLFIWYFNNRARRFGRLCPGCGGRLHGAAGQYVVQWGNCPACRTAIWTE